MTGILLSCIGGTHARGGHLEAAHAFNIAPTVVNPIPNQNATEDAAFNVSRMTIAAAELGVSGPLAFTVRVLNGQSIVSERAMWWRGELAGSPWIEGHPSAGHVSPSRRWGLADLRSGGPRHDAQYVLVQNPEEHLRPSRSRSLHAPASR